MKPKEFAHLLSEDIHTNNGLLFEYTIRELLILEGVDPSDKQVLQHIKKIIKEVFYEEGRARREHDASKIIEQLRKQFGDISNLTDGQIREHIKSYIKAEKIGPVPEKQTVSKVSKYMTGRSDADSRARALAHQARIDASLD